MQSYADTQISNIDEKAENLRNALNKHGKKDTFIDDINTANRSVIQSISSLEVNYYSSNNEQPKTPQEEWRQMANKHCQKWTRAEQKLNKAKFELEQLSSPEQSPLGIIGRSLDSTLVEAAQHSYNQALAEFTLLDENLRKDDDLNQNFETALRKHTLEQGNLEQLQELKKQALFQQRYLPDLQIKHDLSVSQDVPEVPETISLCSSNDISQIKAVIQLTEHVLRLSSPSYKALQQREESKKVKTSRSFLGGLFKR